MIGARFLGCCTLMLLLSLAAHADAQLARFHRQSVESPTRNGWVQASSTEGHYSLDIPCPYNDSTMTPENGSGGEIGPAFVVACDRQDGVRFYAMRIQYLGGRPAAENLYRMRMAGTAFATGRTSEGQVGGRDYFDSDVDRPDGCAYARVVRAGADNLLMLVEPVHAPALPCGSLKSDADRFRASIAIQE